ncbi:MAG: hypothetical protein AB7L28_06610 [Kofleriaceae bacterium]
MRATSLLAAIALGACSRPAPRVLCHNANCVEPTDPADDDSLATLHESLALTIGGKPAIDGIEIDIFWRGSDATCLFAHDLEATRSTLATEVADELAAHIAATATLTATPGPFRVYIELKPHVAPSKTSWHSPEQRTMHADCAWDVYSRVAAAAVANARDVEVVFGSFEPSLLREMVARAPGSTPTPYRYSAFYGIPRPLDPQTRHPISDYTGIPISLIEAHPQWLNDAQYEGLLSQRVEIMFWMFSATVETFQAIEQYEPDWVGTSEASLMRRWLEY